ncbi:hypothetical protein HGA91_00115 [candidate division WWE3 bacterium]|nr:hypothetical protein [candidate division WWE3 bacterium]
MSKSPFFTRYTKLDPLTDSTLIDQRIALVEAGQQTPQDRSHLRDAISRFLDRLQSEAEKRDSDRDIWFNFHYALALIEAKAWDIAPDAIEDARIVAYQLNKIGWQRVAQRMHEYVIKNR